MLSTFLGGGGQFFGIVNVRIGMDNVVKDYVV